MKFFDIFTEHEFTKISELAPVTAPPAPGMAPTAAPAPGAAPAANPAVAATQDPQAQAKMLAQQALDRANQKKQLDAQIKQKQQDIVAAQKELQDLQKQMAAIK